MDNKNQQNVNDSVADTGFNHQNNGEIHNSKMRFYRDSAGGWTTHKPETANYVSSNVNINTDNLNEENIGNQK